MITSAKTCDAYKNNIFKIFDHIFKYTNYYIHNTLQICNKKLHALHVISVISECRPWPQQNQIYLFIF